MLSYNDAKEMLLSGDSSCANFFNQGGYILEYAYSCLLDGKLITAEEEFKKIQQDFRANWALKLIGIINQRVQEEPTYFQIRNFLEIDLNLLLLARKPDYVENIINSADYLYSLNQESYKFIARVMYNNDFPQVALYYLLKAKKKFYNDPEMHYLLANCYINKGEKNLAKKSLDTCLKIIPNYLPAIRLKESLKKN